MKKFLASLILIFVVSSGSYGAVSEDMSIYVRKDVFELEMRNLNSNVEKLNSNVERILTKLEEQEKNINNLSKAVAVLSERVDGNYKDLDSRIKNLDAKIDVNYRNLDNRIKNLDVRMEGNYRNLDSRISDLRNGLYLGLVLFGIVVAMPFFNKLYEEHKTARKSSFTLEDVQELMQKLIEENNAKLLRKIQA